MVDYDPLPTGRNCVLVAQTSGKIAWKVNTGGDPRVGLISFDIKPNLDSVTTGSPEGALPDGGHLRIYAFKNATCGGDWLAADLYFELDGADIHGILNILDSGGTLQTSGAQEHTMTSGTTLDFCVGSNSCGARVSQSTYPIRACHDYEFDNPYFVLSNEGDTALTFDEFWQTDHYDHDEDCPACYCSCDGYCVPLDLCLTFNDENYCSDIDGNMLTMSRLTPCTWQSEVWYCPTSPVKTNQGTWELTPPYAGGISGDLTATDYVLTWTRGGASATYTPNANSTCDPFYLEFDPIEMTTDYVSLSCCEGYMPEYGGEEDYEQGWFYPTITECPEGLTSGGGAGGGPISGGGIGE